MMRLQKTEMLLVVTALVLGLSSLISPDWLVFTSTLAIAAALVVMGVVMLMRAGLVMRSVSADASLVSPMHWPSLAWAS